MTRQLLGLKQPLQTKECKQVTGFQTWMIWIMHSVLSCQKWTLCISQRFLQAIQATQMRLDKLSLIKNIQLKLVLIYNLVVLHWLKEHVCHAVWNHPPYCHDSLMSHSQSNSHKHRSCAILCVEAWEFPELFYDLKCFSLVFLFWVFFQFLTNWQWKRGT